MIVISLYKFINSLLKSFLRDAAMTFFRTTYAHLNDDFVPTNLYLVSIDLYLASTNFIFGLD